MSTVTTAIAPNTCPIPVAHQVERTLRDQISKFAPNCNLIASESEDLLGSLSSGSLPALEEALTSSGHTTPHSHLPTDLLEFGDSPFRAPLEDDMEMDGYSAPSQWSMGDHSLLAPPPAFEQSPMTEGAGGEPATASNSPHSEIDVGALRAVLEELLAKQRGTSNQAGNDPQYAEVPAPYGHTAHSSSPGGHIAQQRQHHPTHRTPAHPHQRRRAEFVQRDPEMVGAAGYPMGEQAPMGDLPRGNGDQGRPTPSSHTSPAQSCRPAPRPTRQPQVSEASLQHAARMVLQALSTGLPQTQEAEPGPTNAGPFSQGRPEGGRGITYPEWPPMAFRHQQHQHQYTAPPQSSNTFGGPQGQQQDNQEWGEEHLVRLFLSFPLDVPLREVRKMCSGYGPVHSARALRPTRPPRAKNCAFVNFYHHSDAQKVVDAVSHAHGVRLPGLEGRVQCRIADAANWPAPRASRKGQPGQGAPRNTQFRQGN